MRSTMMDFPLTIRHIFEHGRALYGDSEVVTCEADGARRIEFRALADRAEQLAASLRRLGVGPGDRVATFGWNNQEHQEAYFAIPCMGAVMHTLNIRLSVDQLRYIIGHAEDSVIIADASLAPVLGPVLTEAKDEVKTVRHLVVYGDGDRSALPEHLDYEELLAAEKPGYSWPDIDERDAAAMCYTSGTTGLPKGVVYSHRSAFLHTLGVSSGEALAINQYDRVLPVVPMFHGNAWGIPYAACWSAPTCCCRTGSRRRRRWPGSSRRSRPPWLRPCRRYGSTSSAWTRPASICPRCASSWPAGPPCRAA